MFNFYKKIFFSHFVSYVGGVEGGAPAESARPVSRQEAQDLQEMRAQIEELGVDGVIDNADIQTVLEGMEVDRDQLSEFTKEGEKSLLQDMLRDMGTQIAMNGTDINLLTNVGYRGDADTHSIQVDRNDGRVWDTKFDALQNEALTGLLQKAGISTQEALALVSEGNQQIAAGDAPRGPTAEELVAYSEQQTAADLAQRISDEDTAMSGSLDIGNEVDYDGNQEDLLMSQDVDTTKASRDIASSAVETQTSEVMAEIIASAQDYFDGATDFPALETNVIDRAIQLSYALGFTPAEIEDAGLTMADAELAYTSAMDTRMAALNVEREEIVMAQGIDTDAARRDIEANAEETLMAQGIDTDTARRDIAANAEEIVMAQSLESESDKIDGLQNLFASVDLTNLPANGTREAFDFQSALLDAGYDLGDYGPDGNGVDGHIGHKSRVAIQMALVDAGQDIGPHGADGDLGPATRLAFANLQDNLRSGGTMMARNTTAVEDTQAS